VVSHRYSKVLLATLERQAGYFSSEQRPLFHEYSLSGCRRMTSGGVTEL